MGVKKKLFVSSTSYPVFIMSKGMIYNSVLLHYFWMRCGKDDDDTYNDKTYFISFANVMDGILYQIYVKKRGFTSSSLLLIYFIKWKTSEWCSFEIFLLTCCS
jgi:hypothetical protein